MKKRHHKFRTSKRIEATQNDTSASKPARGCPRAGSLISNSFPLRPLGSGIRKFHIRLPLSQQLLFLNLPGVRRHIAWRERVAVIRAAERVINGCNLSLNVAARVLDMCPSTLSTWLGRYREHGEVGLLECQRATARAQKQKADGVLCRLQLLRPE